VAPRRARLRTVRGLGTASKRSSSEPCVAWVGRTCVRVVLGSALLVALVSCATGDPGDLSPRDSPRSASASGTDVFAAPTFQPAAGWFTATGSVALASGEVPRSWASNLPFAEEDDLIGASPDQLIPGSFVTDPSKTLRRLRPDQIVIVAALDLPTMVPAPAGNPNFPDTSLPLDLSLFDRQDRWEGQLPQTSIRYRGLFRTNDRYVRVDVYFGKDALVWGRNATQIELDRLSLPNG
jgi:hypothetical protein